MSANYTYGIKHSSLLETLRNDRISVDDSGNRNSPHVFKMNWTYEVPVGRGRRFGSGLHPVLNGILGDWEFAGNGRVQSDRYRITGVKLVGNAGYRAFRSSATSFEMTGAWPLPGD